MPGNTNLLVIVLDDLREDAVLPLLEEPGRSYKTASCIATAPWTLPSCTSLITGLDVTRHRHYWHSGTLATRGLMSALPSSYNKVGLINNSVLKPSSQLNEGFNRWMYFDRHEPPFDRAATYIRRARSKKPLLLLVHSNIPHDFYLLDAGAYYDEAFPDAAGGACTLRDRVISWRDTTTAERVAVAKTYEASARKAVIRARELLDVARARDDFITVIVSDHGEGLDYEAARLHHGGRLHEDLLRVPLYFDLPSTIPERQRADLTAALSSTLVATTDVFPTLFTLAGVEELPVVDGRPIDMASDERIVVSEDRRYLYFKDRFRLNIMGRGKNMSQRDGERNQRLREVLAEPTIVRSYRSKTVKVIVTCLHLRSGTGSADEIRRALLDLGGQLLGSPVFAVRGNRLFALELYDLVHDPTESHNLLGADEAWLDTLMEHRVATPITVPFGDTTGDAEVDLPTMLQGAERIVAL